MSWFAVPPAGSMPCWPMISMISSRSPEPRMSSTCGSPWKTWTWPLAIACWIIGPSWASIFSPSMPLRPSASKVGWPPPTC